jgi:uncharacterized membrane protein
VIPHLLRPSTLRRVWGLALSIAGVALTLAARPAQADLKFTNYYSTPIFVSFSYDYGIFYGQTFWRSLGWYWVDSGQTITLFTGKLTRVNRCWYGYAISADGRSVWTDDFPFRVNAPDAFDYILTGPDHADPRYLRAGFFQVDVKNYDDFTLLLY